MSKRSRRIRDMEFDKGDIIYLEKKKHGQRIIAGYYKIIGFGNFNDFPGFETYKVVEVQKQSDEEFIRVGREKFVDRRDIEGWFRRYWSIADAVKSQNDKAFNTANKLDDKNLDKLNRVLHTVEEVYDEADIRGWECRDILYEARDNLRNVIRNVEGGI